MSDKSKLIKSYAFGVLLSLLFITLLTVICTLIFTISKKIPLDYIEYILIVICGIGVFIGSLISGRISEQNGLILGLLVGTTIFLAILISGFATSDSTITVLTLIRACVIVLFSVFGAIKGVNKKEKLHIR